MPTPATKVLSSRWHHSSTCWRWYRRMYLPRTVLPAMSMTELRVQRAPSPPDPPRSIETTLLPLTEEGARNADRQIDCLRDVHRILSPDGQPLWEMRNGYALPTTSTLTRFNQRFSRLDEDGRDTLRAALRIGIHRDVEVTQSRSRHLVSQALCSALPISYSDVSSSEWESFARLILEAAYEGTLLAAAENADHNPAAPGYLTQVGGGAFGNRPEWIVDAMEARLPSPGGTAASMSGSFTIAVLVIASGIWRAG